MRPTLKNSFVCKPGSVPLRAAIIYLRCALPHSLRLRVAAQGGIRRTTVGLAPAPTALLRIEFT